MNNFSLNFPHMRVGRFSLNAGESIPLHMHENQFGLAYLIRGRCRVKTYSVKVMDDEKFFLSLIEEKEIASDSHCILTPKINAHQIKAIEDSTFLDVFAPGKSKTEGRLSDYLEIINDEKDNTQFTAKKMVFEDVKFPPSLRQLFSSDIIE